jgi:hypothetical protein
MKDDFFGILGFLLILAMYVGLPCSLIAIAWKPDLQRVQEYVNANNIGKSVWETDPNAEICIHRNWFSADYFIKSQNRTYNIGNGYYWIIKVSNEKVKEITTVPELKKCNKLK